MSRINDLVREAKRLDPSLGAALETEVRHLKERRAFGLNFERHTPESVELYGRPVRVGDKVRMLPPRGSSDAVDRQLWKVVGGTKDDDGSLVASLRAVRGEDEATWPLDDLVVVAEHTDTIYPGLVSTERLERGGDQPWHTVINAENLHALKALLYTHRGKVDLIYIDPPYNTGSDDWIYNDKHIAPDDLYRHSKWLAFMERRLLLAKELLADTGVIIVAIGDDEHHRLRMLMDQVFDESNFISNVVWQGGRKNDSKFVSNGADYMLVYACNIENLVSSTGGWQDRKAGVDAALDAANKAWAHSRQAELATKEFRAWIRSNRAGLTEGVARYNSIDQSGRVYFPGDLASPNPRPNLMYDLLHPVTRLPCKRHPNGWRYSEAAMAELMAADRIIFGPDHTGTAYYKRFLDEQTSETVGSVFEQDRRAASVRLRGLLGDGRFPNPKDHTVLMRWLRIAVGGRAVVLDFFGGSGATLEAVARLNVQDGGSRQCILVTNNEVGAKEEKALRASGHRKGDAEWEAKGVHEYVTRPRIKAVVTGERPDGSLFEDTVDANVEFFDLTYEAPLEVSANLAFERIAPLLWLRAGAHGRRIDSLGDGWDVVEAYGVIERFDALDEFLDALAAQPEVKVAFLVTDDDRRFEATCAVLPDGVEPVRLYASYLRNFQIDATRSSR